MPDLVQQRGILIFDLGASEIAVTDYAMIYFVESIVLMILTDRAQRISW
jgi:hypothetical protein